MDYWSMRPRRSYAAGAALGGVWDLIGEQNYPHSFSTQWAEFGQVQLDSINGTTVSADQFQQVTGWSNGDLEGRRVLDAGCGAGRYSEIVPSFGARLTALDLFEAAYTASANLRPHHDVAIVQGDLLAPPLGRMVRQGFPSVSYNTLPIHSGRPHSSSGLYGRAARWLSGCTNGAGARPSCRST